MPGHIIEAKCDCGYQIELYPGSKRAIAYSKQGYEIDTYTINEIKDFNLKKLCDPYIYQIHQQEYYAQDVKEFHLI
jgi:hypothetical protein